MTRRFRRSVAALITGSLLALGVVTAPPAAAASLTWTGNGGPLWSTPAANWNPPGPPVDNDVLTFPAGASSLNNTYDLADGTNVTINFTGAGYIIGGINVMDLQAVTQSVAGTNTIATPITASIGNLPVNVSAGTLALTGPMGGPFTLAKVGAGTLVLGGQKFYTGPTLVGAGSVIVDGSINASQTQVAQGGLLGGSGFTADVTATGGTISPGNNGAGVLTVNGSLTLSGGTVSLDILGAAPGTLHDALTVNNGVVSLGNAALVLTGNFQGPSNQTYMIINNTGSGAIQGTFLNLPQGATFAAGNGLSYTISYVGGTGNDVVLTQVGTGFRLAGVDRVDTAVKISQNSFPANGSAQAVVLARGDLFPDALAGAPLAVARVGPLLLANLVAGATTVDARTVAEIQRVLTTGKTILVLGGATAIPDSMVQQLQALGYQVQRQFAGVDRFQTAVLIAQVGLNNPANLFLVNGMDFPDALSGGPAAVKSAGAILLTNFNLMPTFTGQYLTSRAGATVFALGGPAANTGAAPAAHRIVGADRYATAVMTAQRFFPNPTAIGIASGEAFPDGLTGGAHIGKLGGALLLTAQAALPANVQSYLQAVKATVTQLFIYGGPNAVSTQTATQIAAAVA
jgi:autotransporter-associated beta strand protein